MKFGDQVESGIYVGKINSHHIICSPIEYELPVEVNWYQANEYCKSCGMELPSKDELNRIYTLYKQRPEYFHTRDYQWYWSSTEKTATDAWLQHFNYGSQYAVTKSVKLYVRPIKRIKI